MTDALLAERSCPDTADPLARLPERALADLLTNALATLPPPLREALALHHVRGLAAERIAALLGRPLDDVHHDLARGRGLLRARVRAREYARARPGS